jgi:hypothetical protein
MPDPAKFAMLEAIEYKVAHCCALCQAFTDGQNDWGYCANTSYEHAKHGEHQMGVHKLGGCKFWKLADKRSLTVLGSYQRFLDSEAESEPLRLSKKDQEQFAAALENPPEPSDTLRKTGKDYLRWRKNQ